MWWPAEGAKQEFGIKAVAIFANHHYPIDMPCSRFLVIVFFAILVTTSPPPLSAAKNDCVTAPLPVVISTPGCFRVSEDFSTDQNGQWAISVNASNVHIDLDGHTLAGAGASSTTSGIEGTNVASLTISGGNISGFLFGIRVQNDDDHPGTVTVENVRISGGARGVQLTSDEVVVRNSTFSEMLGYSGWPASHTIGIEVFADRCTIEDNRLESLYPYSVGEVVAIALSAPVDQCQIVGNSIENSEPPEYGRGIAFWVTDAQSEKPKDALTVAANSVSGYAYAFMTSTSRRSAFRGNTFLVDCGPDAVETYDGAVDLNTFVGGVCGDSVAELERRAQQGNPEWSIRLAAALIEGQWRDSPEGDRCSHMHRAETLLKPLVDAGIIAARDQMGRLMFNACE